MGVRGRPCVKVLGESKRIRGLECARVKYSMARRSIFIFVNENNSSLGHEKPGARIMMQNCGSVDYLKCGETAS